MKISASIYSDKSRSLKEVILDLVAHQVDLLHVDCNDDLSVFEDIANIRTWCDLPIDLHIITENPSKYYDLLESNPGAVRANAYDLAMNGVELGGGSIRIHDKSLQSRMFDLLGFTKEEAQSQFGFLMNAFEYGAPPHGGIALGFDRLCSLFGGSESIRDYIAFPKNNSGRDVMIDAPSEIDAKQRKELGL